MPRDRDARLAGGARYRGARRSIVPHTRTPLTGGTPYHLRRMSEATRSLSARVPPVVSRLVAETEHRARWLRSSLRPITRAYVRTYGSSVGSGPFAGLRYPPGVISHVTTAVPKLMGSYERELHDALERLLERDPSTVITAGSADGYYAVGLARRLPRVTVHAFDLEPHWRRICARVAQANGVAPRVILGERLDAPTLAALDVRHAFLLIDCDGCEETLFTPDTIALLASACVLVETHDHIVDDVTDRLRARFAATHESEFIEAEPRWISDFPEIESLTSVDYVDRELGVSEFRPKQGWPVPTPRRG